MEFSIFDSVSFLSKFFFSTKGMDSFFINSQYYCGNFRSMFYCKFFLLILRIKNDSQVWQGISSLYTVFYQTIVPYDYFKANLYGVSYYPFLLNFLYVCLGLLSLIFPKLVKKILRKILQNTSFLRPVFSHIKLLTLYGKIQVRKSPCSGIFYIVKRLKIKLFFVDIYRGVFR